MIMESSSRVKEWGAALSHNTKSPMVQPRLMAAMVQHAGAARLQQERIEAPRAGEIWLRVRSILLRLASMLAIWIGPSWPRLSLAVKSLRSAGVKFTRLSCCE